MGYSPWGCRELDMTEQLNFGHLIRRADSFEKTLMLGKVERREEKGTVEDEMVGWHH